MNARAKTIFYARQNSVSVRKFSLVILLAIVCALASVAHTASAATIATNRPWASLSGLVGYWSFNGSDVTDKVYDRSGQNNHGYFYGGATTSAKVGGKLGQALKFDGVDDAVGVPTFNQTFSAMTITAWVRSRTDGGAYKGIVFSRNYPDISGLQMSDVFPGKTVAYAWDGSLPWNSGLELPQNEWSFVALTVSPSLGTVYVGTSVGLATATNAVAHGPATFNDLQFGLDWDAPSYLIGDIDEVRIYNRALSPAEVNALYRAGQVTIAKTLPTAVKTGLVGWWTFDGKDVVGTAPASANTASILPNTAGTLAGGTLSWANTGNILTSNDSRASVTLSGTAQSDYLRASNFGFAIPADATIIGIEGDIERRRSGGTLGQARDYSVRLVDDTGAFVGSDKAYTGTNWPTTEDWACVGPGCYGGPTDKWGTSLTPTQVNDPDFGMAIQVNGAAAGADRIAEVDTFDIVIYYTSPGGAIDKSGSGNHGTITNGVKGTAGRIGQAMQFDGVDDYVQLTTDTIDVNTVTVCAWIYPNRVTGQFQTILDNNRFAFGIYSGGSGELWLDSNTSIGSRLTGSVLTAKQWQHVCAVRQSGANGPGTLYLNGSFDASGNSDTPVTSGLPLTISEAYSTYVFDGKIDDVRIYNRALSPTEVKKIYNEGAGTVIGKSEPNLIPSGLVGYWSFNGPDFTDKVYDKSGQGNHGYVVGAATNTVKVGGKVGQGIKLDGVDDYINAGSGTSLDDIVNLTACAWIYPTTRPSASNWKTFLGKAGGGVGWSFQLYGYSSTETELDFWRSFDSSVGEWRIAGLRIKLGVWQHVCVTYNKSSASNVPTIYINGAPQSSYEGNPPAGSPHSEATANFYIGSTDGSSEYYGGQIDEARIYNRILSASEVKKLYQSGR